RRGRLAELMEAPGRAQKKNVDWGTGRTAGGRSGRGAADFAAERGAADLAAARGAADFAAERGAADLAAGRAVADRASGRAADRLAGLRPPLADAFFVPRRVAEVLVAFFAAISRVLPVLCDRCSPSRLVPGLRVCQST